jgi:hypothetical protein
MNASLANLREKLELYEECIEWMRAHPEESFEEVAYLFGMGEAHVWELHKEAGLPKRKRGRPCKSKNVRTSKHF